MLQNNNTKKLNIYFIICLILFSMFPIPVANAENYSISDYKKNINWKYGNGSMHGTIFSDDNASLLTGWVENGNIFIESNNGTHLENQVIRINKKALNKLKGYKNGSKSLGITHIDDDGNKKHYVQNIVVDRSTVTPFVYLTVDFSTVIINGMTGTTTTTLTGLSENQSIPVPNGTSYDLDITNQVAADLFGSEYVCNAGETDYISVSALDSTHFVVTYQDVSNSNYGTAVIGEVSGNTISYGSEYVFNSAGTYYTAVAALDSTHFVVTYTDSGNSDYGTAIIGTVSGNTIISYGTPNVFNTAYTHFIYVTALDSEKFVVTYTDSGNSNLGTAIVGIVSGNTITSYGSEYVFTSHDTYYKSVATLDPFKFVVVYCDFVDSLAAARIGDVSGTTITYGDANTFNAESTMQPSVAVFDNTKFVVVYDDAAKIGTASGTTIISYGVETIHYNGAQEVSVTVLDSNHFVVAYQGGSSYGIARCGDVSGTTITYGDANTFNAAHTLWNSITTFDSTHFGVAYRDSGNSYYGTAVIGDTTPPPSSNIKATVTGDFNEQSYSPSQSREFTLTPTGYVENLIINTTCTNYDVVVTTYWTEDTIFIEETVADGYVKQYINYTPSFNITSADLNTTIINDLTTHVYLGTTTSTLNGDPKDTTRILQEVNASVGSLTKDVEYLWNVTIQYSDMPTIELLSQTPSVLYQNSTGNFNLTWGITHNASGLNNSSIAFVHTMWDAVSGYYNHSIRPPNNDIAVYSILFGEQIIRGNNRNETLNFENNVTITEGNIWKWGGMDENCTELTIESINSTYTKVHINTLIHDHVFSNMWYLDRSAMQAAPKTQYAIYKDHGVLIKFWDTEAALGYAHLGCAYLDTGLGISEPTPSNPIEAWYVNKSYNPAGSVAVEGSPYAFFMTSLTKDNWVDYIYTPHVNSSYAKCITINSSDIENVGVNVTDIAYIYLTSQTHETRPYYLNVTNVDSGTNVSFADTNVMWSGIAPFTQHNYTPNMFISMIHENYQYQAKLYTEDNNDLWGNSSLHTSNIEVSVFPPTKPLIHHILYDGVEYQNSAIDNQTFNGTVDIAVGVSTDPDGGPVTHNLTLHYQNETFVTVINNTFAEPTDTFAEIEFNTIPYYSYTDKYTLRIIATDNEGDNQTTWLGHNFTLYEHVFYNVSGYVFDTTTISGATVSNNQTAGTNVTNALGYYILSLENGSVLVTANATGYYENSTSITIAGADLTNVNITLEYSQYFPSTPTNLTYSTYNFGINYSFLEGVDLNNTNSYNITFNGTQYNGVTDLFFNKSVGAHGYGNITIYAYNNTNDGALSTGFLTNNTTIPNNNITITDIFSSTINEGETVNVDCNYTDLDLDTPTFSTNRTDLFTDFNITTGIGSWTTNLSSSGIYSVDFGVSDGYNSISNYTMIITVILEEPSIISGLSTVGTSKKATGGVGSTGEIYENIIKKEVSMIYFVITNKLAYIDLKEFEIHNIKSISFMPTKNWQDVGITIEKLNTKSIFAETPAPYEVYSNVNIWVGKSGYSENNLKDAQIEFTVEKDWLVSNAITQVTLMQYNIEQKMWEKLPTKIIKISSDKYTYIATTQSFSPFAIVGESISTTHFIPLLEKIINILPENVQEPINEIIDDNEKICSSIIISFILIIIVSLLFSVITAIDSTLIHILLTVALMGLIYLITQDFYPLEHYITENISDDFLNKIKYTKGVLSTLIYLLITIIPAQYIKKNR